MSVFEWVVDTLAKTETLDLYFIITDLLDIPETQADVTERGVGDAQARAAARGYSISGGHVFDSNGQDCGPIGKFVG